MQVVKLNVDVDQESIREEIKKRIDKALTHTLFLVDINHLSKITCMSKSFLEQEILCDHRMKLLERRKEKGKRYWFYKESLEVITQILDEW